MKKPFWLNKKTKFTYEKPNSCRITTYAAYNDEVYIYVETKNFPAHVKHINVRIHVFHEEGIKY